MITKEKLTEIVQRSVEDAWYNRRSLDSVKEQTQIIVNGIMEQLNKPAISNNEAKVSNEEVSVCFNYKCPFDMNNNGICAYGSTKCTANKTDL